MNAVLSRIRLSPGLLLLNALYLGLGLWWVFLIPYNNAPDEATHYRYSVEFILTQHRLPVWGVDDLERFRHALSSYNQMPMLNYVVAAGAARAGQALAGLEAYQGARLASLAWGLVFLNALFAAVRALAGRAGPALLATAAVALVPQVLYSFCYVNADAHSLAIAAVLAWALVRYARAPSPPRLAAAGLAAGLLFSAKYNFFVLAPCAAAGACALAWRGDWPWRRVLALGTASAAGALLVSGFWYARNAWLYGTPLPLLPDAARLASLGLAREVTPLAPGCSWAGLRWLLAHGFASLTLASAVGLFGYLDVAWRPEIYAALRIALPGLAALILIAVLRSRDRPVQQAALWLIALFLALLAQHLWTCLGNDLQPQGRYYFAGLVPLALLLGWGAARQPRLVPGVLALAVLGAALLAQTAVLFQATYRPPLVFALFWQRPDGPGAAINRAGRAGQNRVRVVFRVDDPRPLAAVRLEFPKRVLARYRGLVLKLEAAAGETVLAGTDLPAPAGDQMRYEPRLQALDATGPNPAAAFAFDPPVAGLRTITLEAAIEHRRLRDPTF